MSRLHNRRRAQSVVRSLGKPDCSARGKASEYLVQARLSELGVESFAMRESEVDLGALIGGRTLHLQVKRMSRRESRGLYYRATTRRSSGEAYSNAVHFVLYHCPEEDAFFVVPAGEIAPLHEVFWRPSQRFLAEHAGDLAPYCEAWWLLFQAALGTVPEDIAECLLTSLAPQLAHDERATRYQMADLVDQLTGFRRKRTYRRSRLFPPTWVTIPRGRLPRLRRPQVDIRSLMVTLFPDEV